MFNFIILAVQNNTIPAKKRIKIFNCSMWVQNTCVKKISSWNNIITFINQNNSRGFLILNCQQSHYVSPKEDILCAKLCWKHNLVHELICQNDGKHHAGKINPHFIHGWEVQQLSYNNLKSCSCLINILFNSSCGKINCKNQWAENDMFFLRNSDLIELQINTVFVKLLET